MTKKINEYIKNQKIICDGALGTYYTKLYDTEDIPEKANVDNPDRILKIHKEYIEAGAILIRTNTFACNTISLDTNIESVISNIKSACKIAFSAAKSNTFVAGDIGPIPYENINLTSKVSSEYIEIVKVFISAKVDAIIFETFSNIDDILPAINYIKENSDIFVIVQFNVNQFGYSNSGLSSRKLIEISYEHKCIDAIGFNCGVGPGHMVKILEKLSFPSDMYITSLPNAGYPQTISNRMIFSNKNLEYFVSKIKDISNLGVNILGGCCGTTPEYIKRIKESIDTTSNNYRQNINTEISKNSDSIDNSFYKLKKVNSKKLLAVELAPPFSSDDEKFMEAAHMLKSKGVDVLTFPDSPSGRTRADSILMAEKVFHETGMCVMPHLCCRDKNAIAIRSQLLGAHVNGINNFLVITGDPIPSIMRQSIKSVFNFDSIGLMNIIDSMNTEQFNSSPLVFGGAINQNRLNLNVEINRVKRKMESGASFFLTQPVFSDEGIERLKEIKLQTNATILCGIMPLVSYKNALFMKNEMTGIDIPDEIINRYKPDMTKDEGENTGIEVAKEIVEKSTFCDGYYFSFPFNRVYLLDKIMKKA